MTTLTHVVFLPLDGRHSHDLDRAFPLARHLTDEQWLGIIAATSAAPVAGIAYPEHAGAPVRMLLGDEKHVARVDADGTKYIEPFFPETDHARG